jgi:hypothetical protein
VNTYVLILFRVFKYSYNYQHFEYHARDDNLVHSNVRNVNRCEARCSSGEEHGMSPWRRLQWVHALEKPVAGERRGGEEDGLSCFGTEEMPTDRAEAR